MKKISTTILLAAAVSMGSLAIGSAAFANSTQSFESTITAPITSVKLNVSIGEDLAYRADHVSKKLRDRSRSNGINDGFGGRGHYGQRDLDRLVERLERKMTEQFEKNGIEVNDEATTVLNLVITDSDPNRPTFEQMSKSVSLSSQSFGLGGAEFEGSLVSGDAELGTLAYAWYESDIRDARYGGTWSDANRAIDRFARKTAKSLK
jgi:hypothetical protein